MDYDNVPQPTATLSGISVGNGPNTFTGNVPQAKPATQRASEHLETETTGLLQVIDQLMEKLVPVRQSIAAANVTNAEMGGGVSRDVPSSCPLSDNIEASVHRVEQARETLERLIREIQV